MLKDHLALKPDQIAGPLVIAGLALVAQFIGLDALAFDREAIQSEQYWRLLSAHLVHTNDTHLVMSLAGVLALWLMQGDDYNARDYLTNRCHDVGRRRVSLPLLSGQQRQLVCRLVGPAAWAVCLGSDR